MSRFDRSFAAAQRAYDAMEAPEEHVPLTDEEREHEHAIYRTPEQLRAMDALTLREHIADCARAHGQRDTTPAWTAMRWALDALAERDGAVPRSAMMRMSRP